MLVIVRLHCHISVVYGVVHAYAVLDDSQFVFCYTILKSLLKSIPEIITGVPKRYNGDRF